MKIKTRKLIAAITATALLGSALGVGTYAITKSNNDFGFKGTYNLNAFAEEANKAGKTTITVVGGTDVLDASTTMTLTSTDGNNQLFITVIDKDDIKSSDSLVIGYEYNGSDYNGLGSGLTNVYYSSVTVNGNGTTSETLTAADVSITDITTPVFVVAEVTKVENATAKVAIKKVNTYSFSADTLTAATLTAEKDWATTANDARVTIMATDATDANGKQTQNVVIDSSNKSVDGISYKKRVKLGGAGDTTYRSIKVELTKPATVTVHAMSSSANPNPARVLKVFDENFAEVSSLLEDASGSALLSASIQLSAGTYYLGTSSGGFNVFGLIIDTYGKVGKVKYTEVAEVAATCSATGTEAHFKGSDGKLYQLAEDGVTYTEVTAADLVIPTTAHNTNDVAWSSDEAGHWHICTVCQGVADYAEHTDTDTDGKCDVCGATMVTETVLEIKDAGGNKVGQVSVYGESDTFTYTQLATCVTDIPEGKVLSAITVDETEYTSESVGDISVTTASTITATFVTASAKISGSIELSSSNCPGSTSSKLGTGTSYPLGDDYVSVSSETKWKGVAVNGTASDGFKYEYGMQNQTNTTGTLVVKASGTKDVKVTVYVSIGDKSCNVTADKTVTWKVDDTNSGSVTTTSTIVGIEVTLKAGESVTFTPASALKLVFFGLQYIEV